VGALSEELTDRLEVEHFAVKDHPHARGEA
jgi:hypothetical protein